MKRRLLVVGAGISGATVVANLQKTMDSKYQVVGLVDDDPLKQNAMIHGTRVLGDRNRIPELVESLQVSEILIAIPSISRNDMSKILGICKSTGKSIKIMPRLDEFDSSKSASVYDARDINIEDLLGRKQVELDSKGISSYISENTVMVTGGGGSIGSELCKQIAKFNPRKIVIYDIYENNAYELQQYFIRKYGTSLHVVVAIGSVQDQERLKHVFEVHRPKVVFHAAAHKHVPLMESDPGEAVKNNVFGTLNVIKMADLLRVERFILISTDKAVNPTNVMGATKRICELIMQAYAARSKTVFAAVRFGNVLGSNGSVIPLFCKQITEGGPVTLTDERMTRYFMTIPEAAQLVIQAGVFAKGGEIYVLDMGEPVKIKDLAEDLIKLMGYEPGKDINIEVIGLRPGEKLYEELRLPEEGVTSTQHSSIMICKAKNQVDFNRLEQGLIHLRRCSNESDYIYYLQDIVPSYTSDVYAEVAASMDRGDT